jgi:hypothetical protein
MKKTTLTLVALAFGSCVAFAQTTPQTDEQPAVNTEESVTTDKMSNPEAENGLRPMEVEELPAAVQESLKGDEFKDYKVLAVAEVVGQETTSKFYQAALAQGEATEPSMIVLFNEKGKAVAQKETAKQEE